MNAMMVCSYGRKGAFEKMEKWSKKTGWENLGKDVNIKLEKLMNEPTPEWLLWGKPSYSNYMCLLTFFFFRPTATDINLSWLSLNNDRRWQCSSWSSINL